MEQSTIVNNVDVQDGTVDNDVNLSADQQDDIETEDGQTSENGYKSISERLALYDISLTNVIIPSILNTMLPFNYTQERIAQGESLLEAARLADAQNQKEYGEQYAATAKLEKEFLEASKPYIVSLAVARVAFKRDPEAKKALVLRGPRSHSLSKWIRDADVFYKNLLSTEKYLQAIATFGRTKEMLEAEYKEVKDVENALADQKKEIGEALASTKLRDTKIEMLDEWMSDFYAIARIALAGQPEALKKLGIG